MSDPILCPSCKNPINQHTLQGMRLTIDTWCTYRPQDIAADLEAKLKTKERDTEHLLELGKQLAALTSERDRLRLAARRLLNNLPDSEIELAREAWGNTNTRIIKDHRDALAAALDKDA